MTRSELEDMMIDKMEEYGPLDHAGWHPYWAVEEIIDELIKIGIIELTTS